VLILKNTQVQDCSVAKGNKDRAGGVAQVEEHLPLQQLRLFSTQQNKKKKKKKKKPTHKLLLMKECLNKM
jgi:hypothetical protein